MLFFFCQVLWFIENKGDFQLSLDERLSLTLREMGHVLSELLNALGFFSEGFFLVWWVCERRFALLIGAGTRNRQLFDSNVCSFQGSGGGFSLPP